MCICFLKVQRTPTSQVQFIFNTTGGLVIRIRGRLETLEERFWSKVDIKGLSDCWEWKSSKDKGYGKFEYLGRTIKSHRFSWMLINGDIPNKLLVLHKCDNKSCVNPLHLYIGNYSDNIRDAVVRKRGKFMYVGESTKSKMDRLSGGRL